MSRTKKYLLIDSLIFAAFIPAAMTGLLFRFEVLSERASRIYENIHLGSGMAMLALITLHLILHKQWILTVGSRFFKKTNKPARINFLVDCLLSGVFTLICLSGLVNGLERASQGEPVTLWYTMHRNTGTVILLYASIHLALHWKWVKSAARISLTSGRRGWGIREKGYWNIIWRDF